MQSLCQLCDNTLYSPYPMDVYTTSFTYPRRSPHASLDFPPATDLRPDPPQSDAPAHDSDAIQKLAMMAMSLHGCRVSYFLANDARSWNFHITGAYQQVMATRGMILKECPIQVCSFSLISPPISHSPLHSTAQPSRSLVQRSSTLLLRSLHSSLRSDVVSTRLLRRLLHTSPS